MTSKPRKGPAEAPKLSLKETFVVFFDVSELILGEPAETALPVVVVTVFVRLKVAPKFPKYSAAALALT